MMEGRDMTRFKLATLALAAFTIAACGGSGYSSTTTPPPPNPLTVSATPSLTFGPASLTITAGDKVTFAFGSVAHNVFFDPQNSAPADISGTNANVSIQRTFGTAGTYPYECHIHPSMHGTVIVQ
jgi:plastocyanin